MEGIIIAFFCLGLLVGLIAGYVLGYWDDKRIRADLAELSWEDCAGIMDAFFDFIQGIAAGRETPRHSKEELYKEVLRRFNEYKAEKK